MNHRFEDGFCLVCGASAEDAVQGPIGCQAEATNAEGYLGLALTRREQRLGLTIAGKAQFLFSGGEICSIEEFSSQINAWNEIVADLDLVVNSKVALP